MTTGIGLKAAIDEWMEKANDAESCARYIMLRMADAAAQSNVPFLLLSKKGRAYVYWTWSGNTRWSSKPSEYTQTFAYVLTTAQTRRRAVPIINRLQPLKKDVSVQEAFDYAKANGLIKRCGTKPTAKGRVKRYVLSELGERWVAAEILKNELRSD